MRCDLQRSKYAGIEHPLLFEQTNGDCRWPLPDVWLGIWIESSEYLRRADDLRKAPAAVRFVSLAPLLGSLPSLTVLGHRLVPGVAYE
jgi:protein gp37